MKKQPPFIHATLLAIAFSFALLLQAGAAHVQPGDWYAYYSSSRGLRIDGGDGTTPTYHLNPEVNGRHAVSVVWSYFDPVTLNDGDSITLSIEISLGFETLDSGSFGTEIRFGLFQSNASVKATTDPNSWGADRYRTTMPASGDPTLGWSGFSIQPEKTLRRIAGEDKSFYTTSGTTRSLTDAVVPPVFENNTPLTLELTFLRLGNNLNVTGSFGGDAFAGSYVDAFVDYSSTFDAFGFWTGNNAQKTNINSVSFAVIPEPRIVALLLSGGAFLMAWRGWRSVASTMPSR